jgi:hypothetical protein
LLAVLPVSLVWSLACRPARAQQLPETFLPPPSPPLVEGKAEPVLVVPPGVGDVAPMPPARPVEERPGGWESNPPASLNGGGGRGMLGDLANPSFGHQPIRATYGVIWFPQEPVKSQDTHLENVRQNLFISVPIYQDSCNQWGVSTRLLNETITTGAILSDTGQPFPHELWNVTFGTNYSHHFDNGWIGGGSVNIGSASDKPFHSSREATVGAMAFVRVPQGEHNAWLFSLNFSTNSEVLNYIPIPGIAYFYAPVPWFQATVGLPFASITYRPQDDLTIQLTYAVLTTFHARATYRLAPHLKVFGAFDTNNESFLLVDRPEIRDRFFYFDMRLTGGLQYELSRRAVLELSSGYAFDRQYFQGKSITQSNANQVDVGAGPFLGLQINVNF